MKASSGTTGISTTGAGTKDVITESKIGAHCRAGFTLINKGAENAFFTYDRGVNWGFFPAGSTITPPTEVDILGGIQIKRAGANDVTDVYGWIW